MDAELSLPDKVATGSEDARAELAVVYQPLVAGWLRQFDLQPDDTDDLSQDVMATLFNQVNQNGSFDTLRHRLREVTANRAKEFLRRKDATPAAHGGTSFLEMLEQLEDPASEASSRFNQEHDLYVLRRLLQRVAVEFQDSTMRIFHLHVVFGQSAASIAEELGVTRHAAYMAKSRVMRRLRALAPGLIEDMEQSGAC